MAVQTPPELQAYGWTTVDLWCAPVVTGLYAFLTHAQPSWADLHALIVEFLGGAGKAVEPVDPETARVICALVLSGLFTSRTVVNFNMWKKPVPKGEFHLIFKWKSEANKGYGRSQSQDTVAGRRYSLCHKLRRCSIPNIYLRATISIHSLPPYSYHASSS